MVKQQEFKDIEMKKITILEVVGLVVEGLVPSNAMIINLKPRKTVSNSKINQLGTGYILQGNEQEDFSLQSFSVEQIAKTIRNQE